ncbi:hypothetical protein IE81DRAFT_325981 [Ceraceosorus guamensis]|uniref:Actin-like ATPase domain-containing protein n=1 Tax=Ceraceosorus guamensis TaxID=1522189 RepID=A0A316VUM8_9BASI|nr:hypothetical protein IE81DRAFT_325981 [Ceraceosorus guamensis]PWN39971.1 hypothetical protein IE81DRAFT_325981 [Ceraceosorus guamensis]
MVNFFKRSNKLQAPPPPVQKPILHARDSGFSESGAWSQPQTTPFAMHAQAGAAPMPPLGGGHALDPTRDEHTKARRRGKDWLPYRGQSKRLVIAVDLGTTYSGASYCILTPGKTPEIAEVTAFSGQANGASKVPTEVGYSVEGVPCFFGAECSFAPNAMQLANAGGQVARWFKLHLKPAHLSLSVAQDDASNPLLAPIPFGLKPQKVLADFLHYMVRCVGEHIKTRHANAMELMCELAQSTSYVITIPNGWEAAQQAILRRCCVDAGLVAAESAEAVKFVSEAEASIHFCSQSAASSAWMDEVGQQVLVCDAGGGTVDISTYEVTATAPCLLVKEIARSDCLMAGSTVIDRRAAELLRQKLAGTPWAEPAQLLQLQLKFCSSVKELFSNPSQSMLLEVGSFRDNEPELGIKNGLLELTGEEMAALFEPCIEATCNSIMDKAQKTNGRRGPLTVAMVGGFSESAYFRSELQNRLGGLVRMTKPDGALSKAVASGAVAWSLDGMVSTRVARMSLGIRCNALYRPEKPGHVERQHLSFAGQDGRWKLPGVFAPIIRKGESASTTAEHIEPFNLTWPIGAPPMKEVVLFVHRDEDGDDDDEQHIPEFVEEEGL